MSSGVASGMVKAHVAIAAITAALGGLKKAAQGVMRSMEEMADLGDFADRIGAGVEALQALRFAAEQSGGSAGAMDAAIQRLGINVADAATIGGEMADRLEQMGLNAAELAKLPVEQQLLAVSDAISQMNTAGEQNAAIVDLMGRSAVELGSTLRGGSAALLELTDRAGEHGIVSEEMIRASQAGADAVKRLSHAWTVFKNVLASYVIPAIEKCVNALTTMIAKVANLLGMTSGEAPLQALTEGAKKAVTDVSAIKDKTVLDAEAKKLEDAKKAVEDLKRQGASVTESLRTPWETYRDTLVELRGLLKANAITMETFERGAKKARESLQAAMKPASSQPTPGIGAVTRSSAEGFSAVQAANRAAHDDERRHREVVRVLTDILRATAADPLLQPMRI